MDNEQMDKLESTIPPLAGQAFSEAFQEAVQYGPVLIAQDGWLVEIDKEGNKKFIKRYEH